MTIDEQDLILDSEAELLEFIKDEFRRTLQWVGSRCESPIERVLLAALITEVRTKWKDIYNLSFMRSDVVTPSPIDDGGIYAQFPIGPYRVDFLIAYWGPERVRCRIVVECDGHDFHEKTKLQAARDKRRDRYLQTNGYLVLRFSGSEIWKDPAHCASEIMKTLSQAEGRSYGS